MPYLTRHAKSSVNGSVIRGTSASKGVLTRHAKSSKRSKSIIPHVIYIATNITNDGGYIAEKEFVSHFPTLTKITNATVYISPTMCSDNKTQVAKSQQIPTLYVPAGLSTVNAPASACPSGSTSGGSTSDPNCKGPKCG
jgi:hypothetical protein